MSDRPPSSRSSARPRSGSRSRSRLRFGPRGLRRLLRQSKFYRILRKDRLFAVAFAVLAMVAAVTSLAIPKLWRVTPETPDTAAIQISALDFVQAWSLARSARQAVHLGKWDDAVYAWRGAVANNPGKTEFYRGLLTTIRDYPGVRQDHEPLIAAAIPWLNTLTRTNLPDRLLGAEVLDLHGAPEAALQQLEPFPTGSSAAVDALRARCLLLAEEFEDFAALWATHQAAWTADPRLALLQDGWRMATDDRSEGLAAASRLKKALALPGVDGLHVARLLQLGAIRRGQVDDLAVAIDRIEEAGAPTLAEHGQLWRLLAASGREEEARAKAAAYRGPLRHPRSAARYVEALRALGLKAEAIRFLDQNIQTFGASVDIWRLYYDLLAETEQWAELRRLAGVAKVLTTRREALFAEALFADYRGARGQRRQRESDEIRRELATLEVGEATSTLRIAAALRADDRAESAHALLRANEKALADQPAFWNELFATGFALKDMTLLRRSVAELLRLQPGSPVWKNNRAALLLLSGEEPTEALQLTLEGLSRQPRSPALQINHAIALIQNGRAAEAEPILRAVSVASLPAEAAASYHLGVAEMLAATGRLKEAAEAAKLVERARLLPPQIERLNRIAGPR